MPTSRIVRLGLASIGASFSVTAFSGLPQPFPEAQLVADPVLDSLRGGVLLPNGLDVALGIDIRTLVDGQVALHTVLTTQDPAPGRLRVLVGDRPDSMPTPQTVDKPAAPLPELMLDRRGAGSTLTVVTSRPAGSPTVNVVSEPRQTWPAYPGEIELMPIAGGPPVPAPLGSVALTQSDNGSVVTLRSDSLAVQHLVGQATGVLIANTANDRRIDTMATIDVDLQGSWAAVANGVFSVNAVAADAAARH